VVKNVKIDENTHRRLRVKAAEIDCKISDLCSVVIDEALRLLKDEQLKVLLTTYNPEATDS
jgi:hypothetical protein